MTDNRFLIRTDRPRIKVCWQVVGVRSDRWAQAHRIVVESPKDDADRGRYLHPELWGEGTQGISSRADEARRRVGATLPEALRDRWEALVSNGGVNRDQLQQLVDEATRITAGPQRTDPATFAEDWRIVQELVQQFDRGEA